jgi:acetylornithine deacetylase/succinyl-diaminopimelate desuccinylase-like protein
VTASTISFTDQLIDNLSALCAQASTSGRDHELDQTASIVERLMYRSGLQTQRIQTPGAPVIVGMRAGRRPFTLLLYHHYDAAAPGIWRSWHHEPLTLAERDDALFARGVAEGKGALAVHLSVIEALLKHEAHLPCNIIVVAEGERLKGSPNLAKALQAHPKILRANLCLASSGMRDPNGTPYVYTGSKGELRVQLNVQGANQTLPAGFASTVNNPLWRLLWALAAIKGDDEDIKITGFYDEVEGPSREMNRALRNMSLDDARLKAWGIDSFLFGMSGSSLLRAEVTLPTCNVSNIQFEALNGTSGIPAQASALLDFQLVPSQDPQHIADLLTEHLLSKGFTDITCEILPGAYGSSTTTHEHPLLLGLQELGTKAFGKTPALLPLGPFSLPLVHFQQHASPATMPVASIGLQRPDANTLNVNEHILLNDLVQHGQFLMELFWSQGG